MMTYAFPADLLAAQHDWYTVYGQLAERSWSSAMQTAVLRRRLQRLSVQIATHPHWATYAGRAPEARTALRELARTRELPVGRQGHHGK